MEPTYNDMLDFVTSLLSEYDSEKSTGEHLSFRKFRKRSEHIRRVFIWVKRLLEEEALPPEVDSDAVLTAALFHDAGYARSREDHAECSAAIFNDYASSKEYPAERKVFISELIGKHSEKRLLVEKSTPLELILLMEADLLDETGALSIVWDCMMEGSKEEQSFLNTYRHIQNFSGQMLAINPMVTEWAKETWKSKQALVNEFIDQLACDLCAST